MTKSADQVAGIYRITLGFGYNRDLLAKNGLTAPACWSDSLKPQFKNKVETSNPTTSGTGHTILATLVQLMSEDKAFDCLRALKKISTDTLPAARRSDKVSLAVNCSSRSRFSMNSSQNNTLTPRLRSCCRERAPAKASVR